MSERIRRPSARVTLQLMISLRGTEPVIWRRVLVPGGMTLERLHSVIQAAMGWENRHLHIFEIHGERFAPPDFEFEEEERDLDEEGVRIHTLLAEGDHFTYEYDFGDCWHQDIQVEVVRDVTISMKQAVCIDGARKCPPEDCGGTTGFENFLLAISDPTHLDYAALVEWNGGPFDLEQFNLGEANVQIQLNR